MITLSWVHTGTVQPALTISGTVIRLQSVVDTQEDMQLNGETWRCGFSPDEW